MKRTINSHGFCRLEFPVEIAKFCARFKKATLPRERIAYAQILQELLLQQIVKSFSIEYSSDQELMLYGPLIQSIVPRRFPKFPWLTRYYNMRGSPIKVLRYGVEDIIRAVRRDFLATHGSKANMGLSYPTPAKYIQEATAAYEALVLTMSSNKIQHNFRDHKFPNSVGCFLNATRLALLCTMELTKAEPEPLAFLEDYRKIKLKSTHFKDLWMLSHRGGIDVELTIKPVVSAHEGCVAMKVDKLWVKPSLPDSELVIKLCLSFAPAMNIDSKKVLMVQAKLGSPNDSYDISMAKGDTLSAAANVLATARPIVGVTAAASTSITIKGAKKDWTHSQLKSLHGFHALGDTHECLENVCSFRTTYIRSHEFVCDFR